MSNYILLRLVCGIRSNVFYTKLWYILNKKDCAIALNSLCKPYGDAGLFRYQSGLDSHNAEPGHPERPSRKDKGQADGHEYGGTLLRSHR